MMYVLDSCLVVISKEGGLTYMSGQEKLHECLYMKEYQLVYGIGGRSIM